MTPEIKSNSGPDISFQKTPPPVCLPHNHLASFDQAFFRRIELGHSVPFVGHKLSFLSAPKRALHASCTSPIVALLSTAHWACIAGRPALTTRNAGLLHCSMIFNCHAGLSGFSPGTQLCLRTPECRPTSLVTFPKYSTASHLEIRTVEDVSEAQVHHAS